MHQAIFEFLNYGLGVLFSLLPTSPLGNAIAFRQAQPVLCPTETSNPLLVQHLSDTRGFNSRSDFNRSLQPSYFAQPGVASNLPPVA
jgi:hypothetical protein